jgi:hypothetical protein
MQVHDVLELATEQAPPLRHNVDDIVQAGQRVQRRRRLAWSGGAAALTAAAVASAIVLPQIAGQAPRTAGAELAAAAQQPTTTVSTPSPRPTAGTLTDAVAHLRRTVDDGRTAGEIRQDVAQDLLKAIDRLDQVATAGRVADLRYMVDNLRHMVDIRIRERTVSAGAAASLHADLDRVAAAA